MSDAKYGIKRVLLNEKGKPVNRKKPRGRAFGRGLDNPAKNRSRKPKSDANSLASLLDENIEIIGFNEADSQAYPVEQENCPSVKDLTLAIGPPLVRGV